MRRRAQKMGDAVAAEAIEMLGDRLAAARQHERGAAKHRAQENLQAAIAANIVERRPNDIAIDLALAKGCGEAGHAVDHHFGHAGGAGGQHHPLCRARRRDQLRLRRRRDLGGTHDPVRKLEGSAGG